MLISSLLAFAVASADAPRISKEELRSRLSDKDLVIIDVRTAHDWRKSNSKIRGAVREDPDDAAAWAKKYGKKKTIVLYCAWHNEGTSARVALKLIEMGYPSVYVLKGGWREWEKASYPIEEK